MEKLCFIPIWGKKWWDLKNDSWKWEWLSVSCTFCVMVKRGYSEAFLVFNTLLASNLEEGVATHSSTLAWRTPWTEEPGGLQSTGPQRAGHDRSDLAHILSWHTSQLSQSYLLPATQLLGNVCHNRRRHRFFFFFLYSFYLYFELISNIQRVTYIVQRTIQHSARFTTYQHFTQLVLSLFLQILY